MRLTNIVSSLVLLAAATSAWPTGWDFSDNIKREIAPFLELRADKPTTSAKNQPAVPASSSAAAAPPNNNGQQSSGAASGSGTPTGKGGKTTGKTTGKSTGKQTGKATSKYESTKTFDERLPAGGVSMITPAPLAGSQYYKIEDWVTFAWNYTSLSITPRAVDVLAACSLNQQTYTIALNQSITGPSQTILWDTGAFESSASIPLVVATYTLVIYDAASSPDAQAKAGYLAPYSQFMFGMYTPQPGGKQFEDYVCATCNGAGTLERHTIGFLLGMVVMTVLSFGWFAGVAGMW